MPLNMAYKWGADQLKTERHGPMKIQAKKIKM